MNEAVSSSPLRDLSLAETMKLSSAIVVAVAILVLLTLLFSIVGSD